MNGTLNLHGVLDALNRCGTRFVLVGGVAVAAHGYVRATADIDLVPDPEPDNLLALGNALVRMEATLPLAGGVRFSHAQHGIDLRRRRNLTLDTPMGGIDVIQTAAGVPTFAQLDAHAIDADVFGVPVRVCDLADLRAMKAAADRPIDRADLAALPASPPSF